MRVQQFLVWLANYNYGNATTLASQPRINGGWEVWFQVELAMYLQGRMGVQNIQFTREEPYPNSLERCDFFVEYNPGRDQTYIELKCQNPFHNNPVDDVFDRLCDDIDKQRNHSDVPGFCLAVAYCTIDNVDVLYQFLGVNAAFALDCRMGNVYNTNQIHARSGQGAGPQLYVLGVSP